MNEESAKTKQIAKKYLDEIKSEIQKICDDVLDLIDKYLIPISLDHELKVFYLKLKGDYNRYIAEVTTGNERNTVVEKSLLSYKQAFYIAKQMPATHPVCLDLVLNISIFYYEILNFPEKAIQLVKQTIDAISKEENISTEAEATKETLHKNLNLWKEIEDNRADEPPTKKNNKDLILSAGVISNPQNVVKEKSSVDKSSYDITLEGTSPSLVLTETFKAPPNRLFDTLTKTALGGSFSVTGKNFYYSGSCTPLIKNSEIEENFHQKKDYLAKARFNLLAKGDSTELTIEAERIPDDLYEEVYDEFKNCIEAIHFQLDKN